MLTALFFDKYKKTGPCSYCGARGSTGGTHVFRIDGKKRRVLCGGRFTQEPTAAQGSRVKRYRRELKRAGVRYHETMYVNACVCRYGFGGLCEPGRMVVVFTSV